MADDLPNWLRARLDEDEAALDEGLGGPCEGKGLHLWPDQARADIEAKRRIIDLATSVTEMSSETANAMLRALALRYAGRPGYRVEWLP